MAWQVISVTCPNMSPRIPRDNVSDGMEGETGFAEGFFHDLVSLLCSGRMTMTEAMIPFWKITALVMVEPTSMPAK